MFWTHYRTTSPSLDQVLNKEVLTLKELLEEECLFEELKSPNRRLIDFITREDILQELVGLVTEEPSTDLDEKERYRLANIACEVLTARTPAVNEKLSEEAYLTKLFSFLEQEPPLNPLLASFFARTISTLILKHDQNWYPYQFTCLLVLEFLKSQNNCLNLLIKHLGTSSIMELTLTLLNEIEGSELQKLLVDLVESERVIEKILALFDSSVDEEIHNSASFILSETIKNCKKEINLVYENKLMDYISCNLLTPVTVNKLLEHVFANEVCESNIIGCVDVLLALVCPPPEVKKRKELNSEDATGSRGTARDSSGNYLAILSTIVSYLPKLQALLIDPPKRNPKLPCSTKNPFGKTRLSIVTLITNLISTNEPEIISKLVELRTMQLFLDMFFQYPSNNFLHTQVIKCLTLAMDSTSDHSQDNPLLVNIFLDCHLLNRVLDAWKENTSLQASGQKRRGYMGHLINLGNSIFQRSQAEPVKSVVTSLIEADTLTAWQAFVSSELIEINKINARCLGGKHPLHDSHGENIFYKPRLKLTKFRPVFDMPMDVGCELSLPDEENPAEDEFMFNQACSLKRSSRYEAMLIEDSSFTQGSDDEDEDEESLWMDCSEPCPRDS